jgi:hypothetical protein
MLKKTIVLMFGIVFFLQAPSIGIDKTLYWFSLGLEVAEAVGGSPIYELEKKISPNSSIALQVFSNSAFWEDWLYPDRETGYRLLGIGGAKKWYFTGEPFSGSYVSLGASIKTFEIKKFISNELANKGSGLFALFAFEVGYAWRWFDPITCKVFLLREQAVGLNISGTAEDQIGEHLSLGFKAGFSFD